MPQCVVKGCSSGSRKAKMNGEKAHTFRVPCDEVWREKWLTAVRRPDLILNHNHVVCEKHFRAEDLIWKKELKDVCGNILVSAPFKKPNLQCGVIPTIFPWTKDDAKLTIDADGNESLNEKLSESAPVQVAKIQLDPTTASVPLIQPILPMDEECSTNEENVPTKMNVEPLLAENDSPSAPVEVAEVQLLGPTTLSVPLMQPVDEELNVLYEEAFLILPPS